MSIEILISLHFLNVNLNDSKKKKKEEKVAVVILI